jgi:hypothetical protein
LIIVLVVLLRPEGLITRTPSGVGRKLFGFTLVPPRDRVASSGAYPFERAAKADQGGGS